MKRPLKCGCCSPSHVKGITIKGIDKTTGETIWEYGPGNHWRHHYGADAISGVVPNLAATLDKYAIGARAYPSFQTCGNRNTATLDANCAEALTITKLDSLDGTIVESATLTGFFCDVIGETFVGMMNGLSITNAAGLSGGDYVIVGERWPFIEFQDFTDNAATKSYILHAHGQQAGNVYLKTRTSNETITIPHDSTAGEVEALFEATSDCVSATATGGPWPLVPISIEVEWSVSSGDISAISATDTNTASEESVVWDYTNDTSTSIGVFTLTVDTIKVGTQFKITFPGGAEFFYTSATSDVNTFVAAMGAALGTFVATNTGLVPADDPGEVQWGTTATNVLTMNFTNVFPDNGPVLATIVSGGGLISDSRPAGSCAAAYDTATGEMTSAVGYNFGYSEHRPTLKMFEEVADNPSVSGLNVLGILAIGSGPDNSVVITPALRGTGDVIKSNVMERWDIASGEWSFAWQIYCNGEMGVPLVIQCESGHVICNIRGKRFDTVRDRNAARIRLSDTDVTELSRSWSLGTLSETVLYDDTDSSYLTSNYQIQYYGYLDANRFKINAGGDDTNANGDLMRLGSIAFGSDGTSVFSTFAFHVDRFFSDPWPEPIHAFICGYFPRHTARSTEPQQFRFVFDNMPGTNYTAWLDWFATVAEIEDALEDLFGVGNVTADSLPTYHSTLVNSPVAEIERGHFWVTFLTDTGFSPGSGYIPAGYLSSNPSRMRIEVQTITPYTEPSGIAAYDPADATLLWSRPWGTVGAATISQPLRAWLQGDLVYAYGELVDSEL